MQQQIKLSLLSVVFWIIFLLILLGTILPSTSFVKDYSCQIESFNIKPRFECDIESQKYYFVYDGLIIHKENSDLNNDFINNDNCHDVENDILNMYNPSQCYKQKWEHYDVEEQEQDVEDYPNNPRKLCPPDAVVCFEGGKKFAMQCPLAYNISLAMHISDVGYVEVFRDIGTNSKRFAVYKQEYEKDKEFNCRIIRFGDDKVQLMWIDDIEKVHYGRWFWFISSVLAAIGFTIWSITLWIRYYKNQRTLRNSPSANGGNAEERQPLLNDIGPGPRNNLHNPLTM